MRCNLITLLILLAGTSAHAGVYGRLEKLPPIPDTHRSIRLLLGELRDAETHDSVRPVVSGSLRAEFLALRERLKTTPPRGPTSDLMDLGVCELRLGQPEKAREILEALLSRVPSEAPERFQILANLATTYLALGSRGLGRDFLERAYLIQIQALKAWPDNVAKAPAGWTLPTWRFLLHAERLQLKLMRGRLLEATSSAPGTDLNQAGPDSVFEGPLFADGDAYRAGPAGRAIWEMLPEDATDLIRQLVVWMPLDNRVYWLLGEVNNASGETDEARRILEELANARQMRHVRLLGRHLEVLKNTPPQTVATDNGGSTTADQSPPGDPPPQPELTVNLGSFWRIFLVGIATGAMGSVLIRWQLASLRSRR